MTRVRIGVIGAGAWGLNHVRVAARSTRCELVAVADHAPDAAARVHALSPTTRVIRDPDSLLSDPTLDALVIATPAATHTELALAALAANKHVLVEKPVALSLAAGQRLADAARGSQRHVLVGHLLVHHPAVAALRDVVRSGALGALHYIHATRANLGRIRADESALWSFGPHDLSVLDVVLDATPHSVSARGHAVHHPNVEDVVFVTIRYATGELAELHLSRVHPRKERHITFVGSDKLVTFDDAATDKLRIYSKAHDRAPEFTQFAEFLTLRDGDVHIPRVPMLEPLEAQLEHFADCIAGQASPRADLASALRGLAILDAAQRSLDNQGMTIPL